MSAFARLHRRTLRVTGVVVRQRTALAIDYASNAISATVPIVGATFVYRMISFLALAAAGWVIQMVLLRGRPERLVVLSDHVLAGDAKDADELRSEAA